MIPESGQVCFTGYPFVELGDPKGRSAPIRKVIALTYDGEKYVTVMLPDGQRADVKAGYLFETEEESYLFEIGERTRLIHG